ncbi:unnamed protein product [Allacma fusca]|uniref:BTB domain-containing protein n=1 Tax=Allacma fusca TaxID=39272 RepID=A0A8J2NS44_9HEXA|nr:unnamed protein product [Allacma fusca]
MTSGSGAENFLGTWKIFECIDISPCVKPKPENVEGTVFVLQDNGEIRWEIPSNVDPCFPLFLCDCFEVVYSFVGVSVQMGAVSGHMFEFWVDRPVSRDMMRLTFEGWCILNCQQVSASQPQLDFSYSLLTALTEGFFSDIDLVLDSTQYRRDCSLMPAYKPYLHKEFKLHSVILKLSGTKPEALSLLSSDVVEVLLYFLYSQSLPLSLTKDCANRCIAQAPECMTDFTQLCRDYVHRTALRNRIVKLVNKVHACAEEMVGAFHHNSVTTPSRFCYVIKLALRYASVAFIKLVEICVLYGEESSKLTREERLEILRYAKARLPIFLTQFIALLRCIKNDFSTVKPSDRNDIAAHVVPEIEILLNSLCNLMREARDSCNDIWAKWSNDGETPTENNCHWNPSTPDPARGEPHDGGKVLEASKEDLTRTLYAIFRERELVKFHSVHSQINAICIYLAQKKENFEEMALASKIRCVSRNLEQLIEELPVFLLRLEEIMVAVDDRFQWKDFKFCLQLAISQVCQTIHHLKEERSTLQKFFITLVDLIQSDEFYRSLLNLKLITKDKVTVTPDSGKEHGVEESESATGSCARDLSTSANVDDDDLGQVLTNSHGIPSDISSNDLNLVSNLCTPPKSKNSILAQNAAKLLFSPLHSDMVFEISNETESLEIPSHRVIVAARCDWFRRALLSGMKESIQKRIVIHDCSVAVFQQFLRYVYTGQFGTDVSEYLSELIALADRYEIDGLKSSCEQELALRHLDENSVIYLLSMADQFNARSLRRSCMEYIASNPGVMAKELFEELSPELQMEVYDITMWSKANRKVFSTTDELLTCPRYMLVPDSPTSSSSSTTSPLASPRSHTPQCRSSPKGEDSTVPFTLRANSHGHCSYSNGRRKQKHHRHSKSRLSLSAGNSTRDSEAEARPAHIILSDGSADGLGQEQSINCSARSTDSDQSQVWYAIPDPAFIQLRTDAASSDEENPKIIVYQLSSSVST